MNRQRNIPIRESGESRPAQTRIDDYLQPQSIRSHYQPIRRISSNEVIGYEALMRPLPHLAPQGPEKIFAAARAAGMLGQLDMACLRSAISNGLSLNANQRLFINMSASTLLNVPLVLSLLEESSPVGTDQIVLEITERENIDGLDPLIEALAAYRRRGIQIALDDVGSGYASLVLVAGIQPDFLKIERLLVQRVHDRPANAAIIEGIITSCKKLGSTPIAEGVETAGELATLRTLGVKYAQGHHLGRPQPVELHHDIRPQAISENCSL